ncbi:MAG: RES family NAD+ phosphorylase [bacterium]
MLHRVSRAVRVCGRTYDPRKPSGRANRWNAAHERVLYLAEHFGTALLERVVHTGGAAPAPAHATWVSIPDTVSIESLQAADLPGGWDNPDDAAPARRVGSDWYQRGQAAILVVPSLPGRPFESNVVLNTTHPDARKLRWGPVVEIPWDARLFG